MSAFFSGFQTRPHLWDTATTPPRYTVKAGCKDSSRTRFFATEAAAEALFWVGSMPVSIWVVSRITRQRQPVAALVMWTLQESILWRGTEVMFFLQQFKRLFISSLSFRPHLLDYLFDVMQR